MNKHVAPFLRSTYNYDMHQASEESGLNCKDKSLAQQHERDEVDINNIVKRYTQTGQMPQHTRPPITTDFENITDYQTAMNTIRAADQAFMEMPAEIRSRFHNDPGAFVEFASKESNRDEMRRMGLWSPEATAAFELKAQTQKDLDAANAAAAEELKGLKKSQGGDRKSPT